MASSPVSSKPQTVVAPVISDEADKALRPWVVFGLPLALACSFMLPLVVGIITAYFPKNHLISGFFGIPVLIGAILWMVPMYYVFTKVYGIRLGFGRKYIEEKKWKEADAALGSTDPLMLKFFDRTGEAHYLWAQALDGLGKKVAAEKAREFIRKRRGSSEYASKIGGPPPSAPLTASQLRKRETSSDDDAGAAGTTGQLKKTKRRRF